MSDIVYMGTAEPDGGVSGNFIEIVSSMPSVSVGKFVLYNGTTTSSYTNGYIYKGVNIVTTPHTPQSLTVTQIAGEPLGDITTNIGVFKSAIGNDRSWTYQLECVGKPRELNMFKIIGDRDSGVFTRDTTHDRTQLHQYGWVDSENKWYFTNTEFPDELTVFYKGSEEDVGTPTNENSNWMCMSVESRQTTGMGSWVFVGNTDTPIDLADYGIYCSSVGLIGDKLRIDYVKEVAEVSNDQWVRFIQPLDLSQVSGYDATKNQTLTHDNTGTIAWTDTILGG